MSLKRGFKRRKRIKRYKHKPKTLKLAKSYIGKKVNALDEFRFEGARMNDDKFWVVDRFFHNTKDIIFIDDNFEYRCTLEEIKDNILLDSD
jgi:hypothetical protein